MIGLQRLIEAMRTIVGVPSYRAYREHMAVHHADSEPMTARAFFRYCQDKRYRGGNGGKCC